MVDKKKEDFYDVVSAIVKFIENADSKKHPQKERNDLIENRK